MATDRSKSVSVAGVHVDDLVAAAASIGLGISPTSSDSEANLYILVSADGAVLYIGKAESVARIANEKAWSGGLDPFRYRVGYVALTSRHGATHRTYTFDGTLNAAQLLPILEQYDGLFEGLQDDIKQGNDWDVRAVELVLIRMMVLAGFPVANSQGSGQWESLWGRREDLLAAVAAIESDRLRVPAPVRKEVADQTHSTPLVP